MNSIEQWTLRSAVRFHPQAVTNCCTSTGAERVTVNRDEAVSHSLCRLTVQGGGDDGPPAVDLALPRNADVGLLVPSIVDLVHRDAAPAAARRWRLSRIGGSPLDESMTLNENDISDGDLLLLTAVEAPAPQWVTHDPCQSVAHASTTEVERQRCAPSLSLHGCVRLGLVRRRYCGRE